MEFVLNPVDRVTYLKSVCKTSWPCSGENPLTASLLIWSNKQSPHRDLHLLVLSNLHPLCFNVWLSLFHVLIQTSSMFLPQGICIWCCMLCMPRILFRVFYITPIFLSSRPLCILSSQWGIRWPEKIEFHFTIQNLLSLLFYFFSLTLSVTWRFYYLLCYLHALEYNLHEDRDWFILLLDPSNSHNTIPGM